MFQPFGTYALKPQHIFVIGSVISILLNIALLCLPSEYREWGHVCPVISAALSVVKAGPIACPDSATQPTDTRDPTDWIDAAREAIKADPTLRRLSYEALTGYLYHNDSMWRQSPKSVKRIVEHVTNHKVQPHELCEANLMLTEMNARYMHPTPTRAVLLEYFHPNVVNEVISMVAEKEQFNGCVVGKEVAHQIFGSEDERGLVPVEGDNPIEPEIWNGYQEFRIKQADEFYANSQDNSEMCITGRPVTVGEHTFIFCVMWKGTSHSDKGQLAVSLRPRNTNAECTDIVEVQFQTLCPMVDCHSYTERYSDELRQPLARGEVVAHNFIQWKVLKERHLGPANMARFAVTVTVKKVVYIPTR